MARRAAVIIEAIDRASPVFRGLRGGLATLGGLAATVGAYQFGRVFVSGMAAAVAASAQQERAEVKLAVALANTGQSIRGTLPGLRAYASELQRATGIGDELILENQALLTSIGKLEGEGLKRATRAALDLSASGVELKTAFELVGKAAAGETGTLSRYGIILDQSLPKSQKFEAALGLIEERFGGQAEAKLRTYEGQIVAVTGKFGDLSEILGGPLREVGTALLTDFLGPMIDDLQASAKETDGFRTEVLDLGIALAELLEPVELAVRNVGSFVAVLKAGLSAGAVGPAAALVAIFEEYGEGLDTSTAAAKRLRKSLEELRDTPAPVGFDSTEVQEAQAASIAATERWIATLGKTRPELEAIGIGILGIRDATEITEEQFFQMRSAVDLSAEGIALATEAAVEFGIVMSSDALEPVLTLGREADRVLGQQFVGASLRAGDALVDAALGAQIAWGDFFRSLLADIAKAIVQMLILRAISGVLTGGAGFFFARGGSVPGGPPVRAAAGLVVPGPPNRGDTVPALLRPGELVLNRDQQRAIMGGGGGGPMTVRIELGPNLRNLADQLTVEVERGGARLVATELARPIRGRRT